MKGEDGKVLRQEVVSRDYYRPFDGVVRVGTAAPAPKPAAKPDTTPVSTQETVTPVPSEG